MAKSTHTGIPWLRYIRQRLGSRVHFWPFDGWDVPAGRSVIAEVYPALWSHDFATEGRTADQHDAFSIAAWLSRADRDGRLAALLNPELSPSERAQARVEGWILGVTGAAQRAARTARKRSRAASAPAPTLDVPMTEKACPECGYGFRGGTWGGIDAHWKAFHGDIMNYADAQPIIRAGGKPSSEPLRQANSELEHRATCRGFVSGVLSAAYALGVTGYCIPETETIEDIIDTVVQ